MESHIMVSVLKTFDGNLDGKPYIHVTVSDPIMHKTWEDGQYTSYAIHIETNSYAFSLPKSFVRRRYSEFVHLRKMLKSHHPNIQAPLLPPKALFADRFNDTFIEKRRHGLEKFLTKVVDTPLYLSNKSVHLFLQSNSATQEIESIVGGNCHEHQDPSRLGSHLLLHRFLSEDYADSDRSSDCTDVNLHDYDNIDGTSNINSGSQRAFTDSHSHVSLGSRITICTPTLHVPVDVEATSEDRVASSVMSDESYTNGLVGSSYSATSILAISPHNRFVTNASTNSLSSTGSDPPVRRKKVSFSSEVSVAHVFINEAK